MRRFLVILKHCDLDRWKITDFCFAKINDFNFLIGRFLKATNLIIGTQGYAYHMISKEEQRSFASWINENLSNKDVLKHLLPLKDDGEDLYAKCADGMLLW